MRFCGKNSGTKLIFFADIEEYLHRRVGVNDPSLNETISSKSRRITLYNEKHFQNCVYVDKILITEMNRMTLH